MAELNVCAAPPTAAARVSSAGVLRSSLAKHKFVNFMEAAAPAQKQQKAKHALPLPIPCMGKRPTQLELCDPLVQQG
jgi:hypothetical protein